MAYALTLWIAFGLLLAPPVGAQDAPASVPSTATSEAGLVMDVQGEADSVTKRVGVTVQTDGRGNSVSGAADVIGFPFIENGAWSDVDWSVNGAQVTGIVKRKNGTVEGSFEGTVTATGVSGKFTHSDGRVGLWSWDGPPPVPAMSDEQ